MLLTKCVVCFACFATILGIAWQLDQREHVLHYSYVPPAAEEGEVSIIHNIRPLDHSDFRPREYVKIRYAPRPIEP